jgi:lysophospholipase
MKVDQHNPQHLAATGPNVDVLKEMLNLGASVHLRNRNGRTPLFVAAHAGLTSHVEALREAGAHLHSDELATAKIFAKSDPNLEVWTLAGVDEL